MPMTLKMELKAIADKYRLTEDDLLDAMPSPGWVDRAAMTRKQILELAELVAKRLAGKDEKNGR